MTTIVVPFKVQTHTSLVCMYLRVEKSEQIKNFVYTPQRQMR